MRILTDFSAPPLSRPGVPGRPPAPTGVPAAPEPGPAEPMDSLPEDLHAAEGSEQALSLARKVGMAGLAALSLFGALVAGVGKAEAAPPAPAGPSLSRVLEADSARAAAPNGNWFLSGGSSVSGWPGAAAAAASTPGSRAVATGVALRDVVPAKPAPAQAPAQAQAPQKPAYAGKVPVQPGDYQKYGVNFSQILTDADYENDKALSEVQIQQLFEHMDSFLATYQVNGETAAQMVARIARENKINPWLLLTTLEKESSMVSRTQAPSPAKLKAAMGYGYHDGGGRPRGSSLSFQLEKGAELLRDLYQDARAESFPKTIKVDYGQRNLKVRNAATLALMRYTPHTVDTKLDKVGGGNYLFRMVLDRFQGAARAVFQGP